jgi:hypothetical protein
MQFHHVKLRQVYISGLYASTSSGTVFHGGSAGRGEAAHVDVATAIGSAWTAGYDAAGDMTYRATA